MAEFTIYDSNPIHNADFDDPQMRDIYGWDDYYRDVEADWEAFMRDAKQVSGNWCVFGTLGLWNGTRRVWATGKLIDLVHKCVDNMDYATITENGRGKVTITAWHHDGCNVFELRQYPRSGNDTTEKSMRKHSTNGRLRKALGWI